MLLVFFVFLFFSLLNSTGFHKDPGIWKFSNSFIFGHNFAKEMKFFIRDTKKRTATEDVFDKQLQWEILKIRKLSICYSTVIGKEKIKKKHESEIN